MKKSILLYSLMLLAGSAVAQEKMEQIFPADRQLPAELLTLKGRRMPSEKALPAATAIEAVAEENEIPHVRAQVLGAHVRKAATVENNAGYLNPEGTLFCGMDEAGRGKFFTMGAVVGAWACDLPCWTWRNTSTGDVKSVSYQTWLSAAYPSYTAEELYSIDAAGNFNDSIVARGGWQEFMQMGADGDDGYLYWQNAVPIQTVTFRDGSVKTYTMLNKNGFPSAGSKSSPGNLSFAAGGLPSGQSTDGLWPLTNAVNMTKLHTWFELIAERDDDGYPHYFFGSDSAVVRVDSVGGHAVYTRTAPVKLITRYDKPQRMLYVKNVTLALSADGYNAFRRDTLKLKGLHLTVRDNKGGIIAESDATMDNTSSLSYKAGVLLTFDFQHKSAYGELLHEGFTVDEAFAIELTGFDAADRWGIYSAPSSVHASKSSILYEDGQTRGVDYDPYIMLNGIYPTFELYSGVNIHTSDPIAYPTYQDAMQYAYGTNGDTIKIRFEQADGAGKYNYIATCAQGELEGQQEFDIYSTFKPYDENHYWLMDIERPSYVMMSADYETVLIEEEDPSENVTLWDYYRLFTLYIYATETPQVGDEIKIGKAGRNVVFEVVEVEDNWAKSDKNGNANTTLARKLFKNQQVVIQKGNHSYNIWGQEIR